MTRPENDFRHVLLRSIVLVSGVLWLSCGWAETGDDKDHGTVFVQGTLTESPCNLKMPSAWQTVSLAGITTGQLPDPGDPGTSVAIRMTLLNCGSTALRHGGKPYRIQPMAKLTFISSDGGIPPPLSLRDALGQALRAESRVVPVRLRPGQHELVYSVTPERTGAVLSAGTSQTQAQINFRLSYD